MKKILVIVVGIAAVGIAIWGGLWFVGKGQVEDMIDLEQARAEANGTTITWETRQIGGFPFGYQMRATNVAVIQRETGILIQIPEVVSGSDASDIGRIETRLIGDITIDVPISEAQRIADPTLPKVANVVVESENLLASIEGLGLADRRVVITADEVLAKVDQDDLAGKVDIGASGLNTVFSSDGPKSTYAVLADAFVVQAEGFQPEGPQPTMDVGIDTLNLTATVDAPQTRNLNEILFGGAEGLIEVVYSTGRIAAEANASDASGQGGGQFGYYGGTATGIIGMQSGQIELRSESRQNVWSVEPTQTDSRVAGSITADAIQAHYVMPTAQSEAAEPARLRMAVIDLNADEAFWSNIDPEGALDRSKSELLLDVDATARVTGRLDQMLPGQPVPVELSNISLNTLNLNALGGEVQASGDVEVLQPINLPMGALKVSLSNATAVLLALKQAGLIDEQIRATGAAMLQVYARPTEGEDQWETDLTFGSDGIKVNGLQVQ